MPSLYLTPPSRDTREELGGLPGFAGYQALPMELFEIIKQLSSGAPFWRSTSALYLARRAVPSTQSTQSLALKDVRQWTRGNENLLVSNNDRSAVRITVDSDGIRQIERLHGLPTYMPESSGQLGFIIAETPMISKTSVYMKVM